MNQVVLVGRLVRDPELRYIPQSGTPVASFALAVDRDYVKKDGARETDFIPIEVMGKQAEFCANYLSKGRQIAISGSIQIDKYQNQAGENKTFTKVKANKVEALGSSQGKQQGLAPMEEVPTFEPNFGMGGFDPAKSDLDPNGFQAIDDEDLPF